MTTDTHRRAQATREPEPRAALSDREVELAERRAVADPRRAARGVDAHDAESGQVDDDKGTRRGQGAVGQALVIVAAAAGRTRTPWRTPHRTAA